MFHSENPSLQSCNADEASGDLDIDLASMLDLSILGKANKI
jgi:hypothetical protein